MSDSETEPSDSELHPLFWNEIPEDGNKQVDEIKESLSNMIYADKTPYQLALDFKENGNETFARGPKYYTPALTYYEEAVEWLEKASEVTSDCKELHFKILSNVALIHFKKKNYGTSFRVCQEAIKLGADVRTAKIYFRAAQALLKMKKLSKALKYINLAPTSEIPEQNEAIKSLKLEIQTQLEKNRDSLRTKEKEKMKLLKEDRSMLAGILSKGYRLGPLVFDITAYPVNERRFTGSKIPIPAFDDGYFSFHCLILYPEFGQTDYIQSWHESVSFTDQLGQLFPVPETTYTTLDTVSIFYEENVVPAYDLNKHLTNQTQNVVQDTSSFRKLVKVHPDLCLREVLQQQGFVIPGIPVFYIANESSECFSTFNRQFKS